MPTAAQIRRIRFNDVETRMGFTAALVVAVLSIGSPLFAQGTIRTTTPANAFTPEGPASQVAVEDVAGGRKFRGGAHQLVMLRGTIQFPSAALAEPKLQKLVVHFRSRQGPRLSAVEVRNTSNGSLHRETNITGDFVTRESLTPGSANAWVFQSINVGAPLIVRLSVEFSGGFEGGDPGDFVLTGVEAEFARKPLGPIESTTTATLPPLPSGRGRGPGPGRGGAPPPSAPANQDVLSANTFAIKGQTIADANLLVAALRDSEPEGPQRTGFDIGMGAWQGHTADGAGKQALGKALTPAEQLGFADAAVFSLQWNNNTDFAARGAAIAANDPEVEAARAKARGTPPDGLRAALYWLGFDIATGIFGNPALGAQGNTLIGPGSERIRATLGPDGQQGFNDSLAFNVRRR